jgi:hypothetical protein
MFSLSSRTITRSERKDWVTWELDSMSVSKSEWNFFVVIYLEDGAYILFSFKHNQGIIYSENPW